ncbi:MAG: CRTAC1 family protein [Planctomycetaceae bacterium]|nr:CRTAC1 family protein [Planctomycetaceae bacterium]
MNCQKRCGITLLMILIPFPGCTKTTSESGSGSERHSDTIATVENDGRQEPVLQFRIRSGTEGIEFVSRNGEQSEQFTILESLGGGVGLIDINHDGWDDVLLPGGGEVSEAAVPSGLPCGLFQNLRHATFTDVSRPAAVGNKQLYSHGIARADFDSDGFADFLITGYGTPQLFRNLGDGTFERTAAFEEASSLWSSSAAWGDINGDGHPDVYVARYVNWSPDNNPPCDDGTGERDVCPPRDFDGLPDSLYISDGSGQFEDVTTAYSLSPDGKGLGVILADLDADQDVDIYVTNDTVPNHLFQNAGNGSFVDMSLVSGGSVSGSGVPQGSMGVQLLDYNSDGRFDVWVTNYEKEASALYEGIGGFLFRHVSQKTKITDVGAMYVGWGVLNIDADHDGDEDVFIANGHVIRHPQSAPLRQTSLLMQNDNGTSFRNVTATAGDYISSPHMARGCGASDLDHDGDLDIVITHTNEPAVVLENATLSANWLLIDLVGVKSARDPVGATVTATTSTGQIHRQFLAGGSYASSSSRRLHFGIGSDETLEELIVQWPSGTRQSFRNVPANQTLCLVEGRSPRTLRD